MSEEGAKLDKSKLVEIAKAMHEQNVAVKPIAMSMLSGHLYECELMGECENGKLDLDEEYSSCICRVCDSANGSYKFQFSGDLFDLIKSLAGGRGAVRDR